MFFAIDDKVYGIRLTRVGFRTFAELMTVKENGHLEHTNIVGEVGLYYKDEFNPKTGRKLALARLLNNMNKKIPLSKEVRLEIWQRFFQHYGK